LACFPHCQAAAAEDAHGMIDLDANATTPLLPEVFDAMLPWLRGVHANPSGSYSAAKLARHAIDQAREQVAQLIGAHPEEIVFNGGGTESLNTALHSLDCLTKSGAAVVSAIEHSAVLRYVEKLGRATVLVGVDAGGRLDMADLTKSLEGAAFVSVMTANNETGVIQPVREVAELARERGLPVHTDAVQAAGKIKLDVRGNGCGSAFPVCAQVPWPQGGGCAICSERPQVRAALAWRWAGGRPPQWHGKHSGHCRYGGSGGMRIALPIRKR